MSDHLEASAAISEIHDNTGAMRDLSKAVREFPDALGREARQTIAVTGKEVRDTVDFIGGVALTKGSGSVAMWLILMLLYQLAKKWLGI